MFNVVGQWHPLRLAEDFAMLHNLSGGRGVLGVGRGTVPREMLPLYGRTGFCRLIRQPGGRRRGPGPP